MTDSENIVADDSGEQVEVRRAKLAKLRDAGSNPYPNDFRPSHAIVEAIALAADVSDEDLHQTPRLVGATGRIMAIRRMGKASVLSHSRPARQFAGLRAQGSLGRRWLGPFQSLDIGDIVGIRGHLFRTKTKELTVEAQELRLLTKCLRPLPEKWHGLADVEVRYRQRYIDLMVNPDVREVFEKRSLHRSPDAPFFEERDFLEVETPMMQPIPGGASAKPFITHHNTLDMELYLRVAPELFLKRLLVGGFERVFELNRNFRNEGISVRHNPEFTMVEFYQAYATFDDLMQLTEELFASLAQAVAGSLQFTYGDMGSI